MSSTSIGPFELVRRIARGGMGEVWEARHRTTPVALKFLTTPNAEARALFAEEVRAHACLRHPFVLDVLDLGRVEHPSSRDSDLPRVGTPWIALELASAGTLAALTDTLDWNSTRVVLLAILDALAHAHAHGVIHRDLKPGNILLAGADDLRPGLKLADFGIAHRMEASAEAPADEPYDADLSDIAFAGTPTTMAPEQCRAALRETGPWTDLYALGCIAMRLVSGRWPFQGLRGHTRLVAHIQRAPQPLEPRFPVPDGFSEWVARALAKNPADRWSCAAHATADLLDLQPDALVAPLEHPALETTRLILAGNPSTTSWRRPLSAPPPAPLVDAGLQLFPLRRHATTGREAERDELWAMLDRTGATGRPHCVVLAGDPGAGSTHLAHWATTASHARGRATTLWTRCAADDAPDRALRRLATELLRTHGLQGDERVERIRAALQRWNADEARFVHALDSVLSGTTSHSIRRGAVRRLLCEVARDQPVVAAFSHAGTALDVLRFIEVTLANPVEAPILFIVDLGDATLAGRHEQVFDALQASDRTTVLQLQPLTERETEAMIRQQLPLTRTVVRQVVRATGCWPGRVTSRLQDLAQSGDLLPGPHGFELAPGVRLTLDTPRASTRAQADLDRLLAPLPERAWPALLRAAVLGSDVEPDAWARVCDDPAGTAPAHAIPMLGLKTRYDLLDRMTRCGFAGEDADHTWHFVQPELREAILQRARENGEIREVHSDVARYLDAEPDRPRRHHRRIAHHRAAGQLHEAFAAALDGIEADFGHRLDHIAAARSLVDALDLAADDPRRGFIAAWHLRCLHADDGVEVVSRATSLLADAERYDWPVPATCAHAWLAHYQGDPNAPEVADPHIAAVMDALDTLPPSELLMAAGATCADALMHLMRHEEALTLLERLLDATKREGFETLHNRLLAVDAQHRTLRKFDPIPFDTLMERARSVEAAGDHASARILFRTAAEVARFEGNIDQSDEVLEHVRLLWDTFAQSQPMLDLELAINAVLRADADAVRRHLDAIYASREESWAFQLASALLEMGWATLQQNEPRIGPALTDFERHLPPDPLSAPLDVPLVLAFLEPRLAPFPEPHARMRALLKRFQQP